MGVDASAVARVVGVDVEFEDLRDGNVLFLPQRIAVIAQGATAASFSTTKQQFTSQAQVGNEAGFGSPAHLIARELFPTNGDGVGTIPVTFYLLEDDASGVAASGDITPSGSQTEQAAYRVSVNNILSEPFVIAVGATVATITAAITQAINGVLEMPVIAVDNTTDVGLTAKWEGTSGNDLVVSIVGDTSLGTSFAITQPAGGLVNPDVQPALDQVGDVWESMVINAFESTDTTILNAIQTFGDGRWTQPEPKPFVSFTGTTEADVATAIAVPDARKTDIVNSQIPEPAGSDLPFVIAAAAVTRIARLANNNPPVDYGAQRLPTLTPGADGSQWTYAQRDQAVKGGSSTIEIKDGVANLSDVITYHHPDGEPIPAYRYVVDIVKLQTIIFNVGLIFRSDSWNGAPLIPDNQPTANRAARKPRSARAALASLADQLALQAIIADPQFTKDNSTAVISSSNPKRLDIVFKVKLSGNTNIISIDLKFGFNFGELPLAA